LSTDFGRRYGDDGGVGSLSVGSFMGTWDGISTVVTGRGHGADPGDALASEGAIIVGLERGA
jgi:hypothetical protein